MTDITDQQIEDYAAGKVELKDLVGLDPEYLEQLEGRAQFFIDGGHDERALIMLGMLEELDRTNPLPALLAVELLLKEGRSDAAEAKLGELIERRPDDPEVQVALAELKIAIGELVPAAEILQRVIDADPDGKQPATQRAFAVAAQAHERFETS